MNKSKFLKIQCPECKNQQIVFGKASTKVRCKKCSNKLVDAKGGKARMKGKVLEVLK
jgi:small subunit ribosomal protein S27e